MNKGKKAKRKKEKKIIITGTQKSTGN